MIERELFEAWMQRIMERLDRQDKIISVLINKDAAGVKYMDGERLYDNQDLCEMLPPRMCRKRLKIASFWKYGTPKVQNKQAKSIPN